MKIGAGTDVGKSDSDDQVQKLGKTKTDFIIDMGTNNSTSKRSSKPLLPEASSGRANSPLGQKGEATKEAKAQETRLDKFKSVLLYYEVGTFFSIWAMVCTFGIIYFHAAVLIVKTFKSYTPHTWCPISWLIDLLIDWSTN